MRMAWKTNQKTRRLLLELPNDVLGTVIKSTNKDDVFNAIKLLIQLSLVCKKFEHLRTPNTIKITLNLDQKALDTSLLKSGKRDSSSFFELLISMGANVKTPCPFITLGIAYGVNDYFTKYLIAQGADVNYKDPLGLTPLHWAIADDKVDIIKLLLENKANMKLTNKYGHTPAYAAMLSNKPECLKVLIDHGLDTSIVYTFDVVHQKTIAQWAKSNNHHEIYTLVTGEEPPNGTCVIS